MRILAVVLGLAAASYAAYLALNQAASGARGPSGATPVQQLDHVREAARRIEADALERAAEVGKEPEEK